MLPAFQEVNKVEGVIVTGNDLIFIVAVHDYDLFVL
jgi:hypothetical protein